MQIDATLYGFVPAVKGYEDRGLPTKDDAVVTWQAAPLREPRTR